MIRACRNIGRLIAIVRTLARHDALFPLDETGLSPAAMRAIRRLAGIGVSVPADIACLRPGERLSAALQALGPSFIKLGQALSVRSDVVGEALADDLSALQDRLPPFSGDDAVAAIEAEFGRPLGELYDSFEKEPVAAASIAQVHFAVTADGRDVAVKVLRPGIEQAFARDLDLLRWLAEQAERLAPASRRLRPAGGCSRSSASRARRSTRRPRSGPPATTSRRSSPTWRASSSCRSSATASSMPICTPATC